MFQSLANMWLIPKLRTLKLVAPDLKIVIVTEPEVISLSGTDIDMSIVYTDQPPKTKRCIKLFDEVIQPVCSPEFLLERGGLSSAEDMLADPIVFSHHHKNEWSHWFTSAGITAPTFNVVIEMDNRSNALQAAASGLGWAMDRSPFGRELRSKGKLVSPVELAIPTGHSYFLIVSQRIDAELFRGCCRAVGPNPTRADDWRCHGGWC